MAPRITIYGAPGIGKSTLASQFPEPLFVMTEETGLVGVQAFKPVATFGELWSNMVALWKESELPFKTIVIDSISKLDQLVVDHILAKEPARKDGTKATLATACGGYGAGFQACQQVHQSFKGLMDRFQDRGIAVVYIGHLATVKMKAPDMEDFDKYSIVMSSEKSKQPYIDDVDAVMFCRLKSYVSDTESGRTLVKSSNNRIIQATASDGHVSKNRFNMPQEIPMSFDEISKHIPFYNQEIE
jgi:hypothetical protein